MKHRNTLSDLQNMKAPDRLKARTRLAAEDMRQGRTVGTRKTPRARGFKRVLAAACAVALLLGGAALHGQGLEGASDISHSFGLVAYAADTGETLEPKGSKIVFDVGEGGCDDLEKGFFSGCIFKVIGDDIQNVSASMDKGSLYRYEKYEVTEQVTKSELYEIDPRTADADDILVSGEPDQNNTWKWWAHVTWKLENGFVEDYDPAASYGLLAEPKEIDTEDLREAWHARTDEFDGATLTVTVTFTDGTTATQEMTLHTGKLGVTYPDDVSGPQLTGEVLTDEQAKEQGYVYGVYAQLQE